MTKVVFYICVLLVSSYVVANPLRDLTIFDLSLNNSNVQTFQHAGVGSKRCMKDLGCFEITEDFFHAIYRPINFLPKDRTTINVKFILFTKEHPKEQHEIHPDDGAELDSSPLDPTHPTVFIVHGFFDSRLYGKWMEEIKDNLLLHSEYNVIIVDWSKGNGAPYTQATANGRVVGAEIALLITKLQQYKKVKLLDCHIIGHSLGAHIAGYAGERLEKLGRISALDPAQPYFQNMPPSVRLDITDADFVDVIHTDSRSLKLLALGMSQAVGHVDFYPNNGMSQPGCSTAAIHSIFLEGLVDAARRFVSCNHQRAVDFYKYSINYKKLLPVAYHCEKWEDYLDGQCSDCNANNKNCAIMGHKAIAYKPYKSNTTSIKMYVATTKTAPYWEYTYQIKLKLQKSKSYQDRKGEISLTIQGSKTSQDITYSSKNKELIHGATYIFLQRQAEPMPEMKTVSFSWKSSKFGFSQTLYLEYVSIMNMNIGTNEDQKAQMKTFCGKIGTGIKAKTSTVLTACKKL